MAAETPIVWEFGASAPGQDVVEWLPAEVPGTAASSLRALGRWDWDDRRRFDDDDWWWRGRFSQPDGPGPWQIRLGGLATMADVWVNGSHRLRSESMWIGHELVVDDLRADGNEILLRCEALGPLLKTPRKPRSRWRTRLVDDQNLRWFRTSFLGRMPGWSPRPAPVGPWRPISLGPLPRLRVVRRDLRAACTDAGGALTVDVTMAAAGDAVPSASVTVANETRPLTVERLGPGIVRLHGVVELESVERWWPHTHGGHTLHPVTVTVDGQSFELGRVGFRTIEVDRANGGFGIAINGVPVFCRGACWTPTDAGRAASPQGSMRATLEAARDAGMNMIRVPGTMTYEDEAFHDACDELGIMVWQDLMFANLDYPATDVGFGELVKQEVDQLIDRLRHRPSTTVVCGSSELEQQAAMMGVPIGDWHSPLFEHTLPEMISTRLNEVAWVPSAPTGGALPFHVDEGVANYYGVGAYLQPLTDARRSGVRFASECLAFANVPDDGTIGLNDPQWKERVPRDSGADWDFDDVRDHYLALLHGVDPAATRANDPDRYLELSRQVTGEVMAAVLTEWRRPGSSCRGALILMLRDLWPSPGWGVIDSEGRPKSALRALAPVLAPLAVLICDEGLNGLFIHVVNDGPEEVADTLEVELLGTGAPEIVKREVVVGPHSTQTLSLDGLLNGFRDVGWVYRFGPPSIDSVTARFATSVCRWRRPGADRTPTT
jgi:beta-mannosidase